MYLCVNIVILLVVMMVRTQCMEDEEDEGYKESPAESQKDVKYGEQL